MTSSPASTTAPDIDDIRAAAERLKGHAVVTPLLEAPRLGARQGGRLLIKAEVLQRTGSFKFRGAFNRIAQIPEKERQRGVVTFSSGNHAQAVAAAAAWFGVPAVILMPADAPAIKIDGTRAHGAEIVLYDRVREDREAIGDTLARERGLTLVRPFDDPAIIAGQATAGLELAAQARTMGLELDAVLVPVSGGGLIAGCALALAAESPATAVYAVEPAAFDDTVRSLVSGRRESIAADARSICDALQVPRPGEITFPINARLLAGGITVTDAAVERAMAAAFEHLKLVIEPGGAAALAAVLEGTFDIQGKTVAVVASGGNVDGERFIHALKHADARNGATPIMPD